MNIPVQNCSSCGACANVCAHNAISMQIDDEGFFRPIINSSRCVKCGACEQTCPWNNVVENPNCAKKNPKSFAAYAKNEYIRLESSSGGVFTILAEKILNDGGVVVGVAQHSPTKFGHIIVENKADLTKLRGSKYVQADVGFVYRKVKSLLKSGKEVLFSGTPCQVAALYAVLGKNLSALLITVDIVCHGSPSVKVFEKYLTEIEKENSAHVIFSRFRDKRLGWRKYSMTLLLENDSGEIFEFSKSRNEDKFMRVFLQNICLNASCSDCKYAKLPRIGDISLADYWGIHKYHPNMDDNKGISAVLLNTEHGKIFFDSVRENLVQCESSLEKMIAWNPCIVGSHKQHPKRIDFFANLDNNSLDELIKTYCPYPSLFVRIYYILRGALGRLKRFVKVRCIIKGFNF